jgi:hypothetical protein
MSYSSCAAPITGNYRVIVDRLSFRFPYLREIVKSLSLDGTYVINSPFAAGMTNKLIDIKLCAKLGIPVPRTMVLPQTVGCEELEGIVRSIVWEEVGREIGFPCVLKPYDGYAWDDVYVVGRLEELRRLYDSLRSRPVLLAQQLIRWRDYYRVFCIDKKDVLFVKWIPRPAAMGEYSVPAPAALDGVRDRLTGLTTRLNEALDLDINVVEWCLDDDGNAWVIDAFNEVPDVRPESLPAECYEWVVDKFVACIKDKAMTGKQNRSVFGV